MLILLVTDSEVQTPEREGNVVQGQGEDIGIVGFKSNKYCYINSNGIKDF